MALQRHLRLRQRQTFARRDPELPFHQIEAGDRLGHRVLNLQPRIHLHEPEAVGFEPLGAVGDEFHGAGALITDRLGRRDRGRAHLRAQLGAHARRRRLLDNFLMAALQRAVALVEMDDMAVAVGEDLHFDMARRIDVFFDQHAGVAEGRLRLAHRGFERGIEVGVLVDPPHALAAAAGHRFDQQRITDFVSLLLEEFRLLAFAVIAGHHRHAGFFHQRLGAIFQTHGADRGRWRTDEDNSRVVAGLSKVRVFRKEPVAGMHTVGTCRFGDRDQFIDAQVALGRRCRPNLMRLVAKPRVQRAGVGLRIDRDGAQAKSFGGAGNAAGDFAAVGDENGREHGRARLRCRRY